MIKATATYVCLNCKKSIVEELEAKEANDIQPKVAICKKCSINMLREALGYGFSSLSVR